MECRTTGQAIVVTAPAPAPAPAVFPPRGLSSRVHLPQRGCLARPVPRGRTILRSARFVSEGRCEQVEVDEKGGC